MKLTVAKKMALLAGAALIGIAILVASGIYNVSHQRIVDRVRASLPVWGGCRVWIA